VPGLGSVDWVVWPRDIRGRCLRHRSDLQHLLGIWHHGDSRLEQRCGRRHPLRGQSRDGGRGEPRELPWWRVGRTTRIGVVRPRGRGVVVASRPVWRRPAEDREGDDHREL